MIALLGLTVPGCGGSADESPATAARTTPTATTEQPTSPARKAQKKPTDTVRSYVSAVNARDGRRLCSLLAAGALRGVPLKRKGSGCARSLSASIGQPGAHGEPAWRSCRLVGIDSVTQDDRSARVTTSLRHRLAGSDGEVPVEQDVVYLRAAGRGWLVEKASALLYRAVGVGDVPLDALQPPAAD